ncbi:MAG: PAS domain-containing protein [Pseudomonadota bacterium]|nr:PAS domain-containing protein [Pseudomonadota bacterium]
MNPTAHQILDHLATAIVIINDDWLISHANSAAENLLRISKSHIVKRQLSEIFTNAGILEDAVEIAKLRNASHIEHELQADTISAGTLYVNITFTPLGSSTLLEFQPIDMQLRINREANMRAQQQTNRELLRSLAHEIKNPLGGLRGAAQLLMTELDSTELRDYTRVIIEEADRLRSLMDRLLGPSRPPRFAPTNIHQVMERTRSLILAEFTAVKIKRDYDTSLPEIQADAEQLIQAILNISRNAAQAMQGEGSITFRTHIARRVAIAGRQVLLAIQIDIMDTGPGISPDIINDIFYPLVSHREGGSGLGLTIAQSGIHAHQGNIDVESQPGKTIFTILLPLSQASVASRLV